MELFWKAAAVVILTIILGLTLAKTQKDIAIALTVTSCSMVMMIAMQYLSEVICFLWDLSNKCSNQNSFVGTLLKISGVALVTELMCMLGADAGNSSLGKATQILGTSVILFLSLPIFESFLTIIQEILRAI